MGSVSQGPLIVFIRGMDRWGEGSMKKDPPKDQSHKTTLLWSTGKFTKLSRQEIGKLSWVEENVPTPVPLNAITIGVDTGHI